MARSDRVREAQVNGRVARLPADGRRLIDWLRDDLGLTSVKSACGAGQCGACSVLVDGRAMLACCLLAATMQGRRVVTAEGLAAQRPADPLIEAWVSRDAFQCGYCAPGMLVAARALIDDAARRGDRLDAAAVRRGLRGNLCRCSGYGAIVEGVLRVAGDAAHSDQWRARDDAAPRSGASRD